MRFAVVLAVVLAASSAWARPGFYFGVGAGPTFVSGSEVPASTIGQDEMGARISGGPLRYSTDIPSAAGVLVRLGFNVLGYGAVELGASGHGSGLFDQDTRSWAAHGGVGLRAYPLWHWQNRLPTWLQPLEPSLAVGWGTSWQSYVPPALGTEVGFSRIGSWRFGVGLEYFVISYFKATLDYQYVRAAFDNFIWDFNESLNFPVLTPATTGFHQIALGIAFQFGPEQQAVRYEAPVAPQAPFAPAPAPAGPVIIDG